MAAYVLSFGLTAVCLIGRLDRFPLVTLPPMPYASALLLGLALAALTVACCIGCVWFFAFVRQLFRAYGRFHRNTLAAAKGEPALPPLAVHPQFLPARRRRMRTALIVSLVGFVVCLVLGMAVSAMLAGQFEFWNDWNWFYIHNCRTYDIPIQYPPQLRFLGTAGVLYSEMEVRAGFVEFRIYLTRSMRYNRF